MTTPTTGRIALVVELDGVPHYIALPQDRLKILLQLAQGLCDSGKLPVKKAPEGTEFMELK